MLMGGFEWTPFNQLGLIATLGIAAYIVHDQLVVKRLPLRSRRFGRTLLVFATMAVAIAISGLTAPAAVLLLFYIRRLTTEDAVATPDRALPRHDDSTTGKPA